MPKLIIVTVLAALSALALGTVPAAAHAALVDSDPADGATVNTAPRTVSLTFNESVGSGSVAVTAPDGTRVRTSDVRAVDTTLTADLAESDQRGRYTVAYRAVSGDGHAITGELTFTTTSGRAVEQAAPQDDEESFAGRHRTYLLLGLGAAVGVIGLILAPLRRERRP